MLGLIRDMQRAKGALFWLHMWSAEISIESNDIFVVFTLPCAAEDYLGLPSIIIQRHMKKISDALLSCHTVITEHSDIGRVLPEGVRLEHFTGENVRIALIDKLVKRFAKERGLNLQNTEVLVYSSGACYDMLCNIAAEARYVALRTDMPDAWDMLEELCERTGLTVRLASDNETPDLAIIAPDGGPLAPDELISNCTAVIDLSPTPLDGAVHTIRFALPAPYQRLASLITPDERLVEAIAQSFNMGSLDKTLTGMRVLCLK